MITLKSPREIDAMEKSGAVLADIHEKLREFIKPGISGTDIDQYVEKLIEEHGASAEQKGFEGYEYATCVSVNDEICHGFPRSQKLKNGDLIKVDMVINLNGALSDSCWSYSVGEANDEVKKLMDVTLTSLYKGIEAAKVGNRIGDIGHAIQSYVEPEGFGVVREFVGHGIGPTLHEGPSVPHYGQAGKGMRLKEGMVITIEPMINTGTWKSKMDDNGWTARTKDGGLSCQYEHTIAITKEGPRILTKQKNE
ncbi:type I methionyl aminopeptidase [Marinilactibacillus psychrotolerans]|uniref:Methionine aminopeptidase n=1 Tax=Marinilactibacillus psychrotolerans TaxID=191770 RepID=A0A5R9C7M5_9LACT|nr:type I methionyl aminopeptidase [Marinilactibacillus psychrotolerans]TLQ09171.1 type I methionyl aminopeptidase [Marinilactibacillus psychrotolerans]GEQ32314.1 methionine aminopeptidase [Marinilactibacillus psychrotolerans]